MGKLISYHSLFLLCLSLFLFSAAPGQESLYKLTIHTLDSAKLSFLKKRSYIKTFADSAGAQKEMQALLNRSFVKGYLSASFDSIAYDSAGATAFLHAGNPYYWKSLNFDSLENYVIRKSGISQGIFRKKNVNLPRLSNVMEKIIEYYERNGYPFATLELENVTIADDSISGNLKLVKNDPFTIDSLILKGKAKISPLYLAGYLGIKQGSLYDEEKIRNIANRLKELSFLKEAKPYEVSFKNKKTDLHLYLDNKRANQFDGMLGIMPDSKTTGKVLLTGEVNLFLINSFARGEIISLSWKKLEYGTQELKVKAEYPYIFSLPFGVDGNFRLFKKDTLYIIAHTNLGVQYLMPGGNYIKIYAENKNSSLVSAKGLENITTLPQYADINSLLYGTGLKLEKLDYRYNPRTGYSLLCSVAAGNKTIKKNADINPAVYDKIKLKSTQVEGEMTVAYYLPLVRRNVLKIQSKSGYMYNSSALFDNEIFRIGGLKTIRGMDQESIMASSYSIATVEYRYLFEQNSCVYLFWDGAYYEKNSGDSFVSDTPYGFGAGIDFETRAGIFTLNYALGKQFDNPVEFRSGKIHFGFVNRF